jgi:hypothetical protein
MAKRDEIIHEWTKNILLQFRNLDLALGHFRNNSNLENIQDIEKRCCKLSETVRKTKEAIEQMENL